MMMRGKNKMKFLKSKAMQSTSYFKFWLIRNRKDGGFMTHKIDKTLQYYYDFTVCLGATSVGNKKIDYKVHLHTFVDDKIVNLYFYTSKQELVDSLDYLSSQRDPTTDLNISAIVYTFEYLDEFGGDGNE